MMQSHLHLEVICHSYNTSHHFPAVITLVLYQTAKMASVLFFPVMNLYFCSQSLFYSYKYSCVSLASNSLQDLYHHVAP